MEFSALDLTFDVCIMSALLVLGKIIRTRVPLLQNLFIPSALNAGFIGIILGPFCLNWVPLSTQASSYAGAARAASRRCSAKWATPSC